VKAAELYLHSFSQTYNDAGLAQSKLWPAGTLCITIAANIADTAILGIPGCFPDSVVGFIADPAQSDARFVKYYIETLKQGMQNASRGTTQDNLSVDKLLTFEFLVPSARRQREIASILSAYDDLIENNTRRIAILEEMARRIYEEWFVRFRFPGHENVRMVESELGLVPAGWRPSVLGDVLENVKIGTRAGDHLSSRRYVPIDCIGRKTLALAESKPWSEAQSSLILFEEDDVLFGAMRAYFHKVCVAPFPGVTRTTCFVLRPRRPEFTAFGTMTEFAEPTVDYAAKHAQGATIPYAVWDGSLARMPVLLPPDDLLRQFQMAVSPMLAWVKGALARQNNLRETRDLLLPKLISGELDVSALPEPEALAP
jgi:type I restriction enzyme S subunit